MSEIIDDDNIKLDNSGKDEKTREIILRTAWTLFCQDGKDKVTIRSIAEYLHTYNKLIYSYFPKKENLMLEMAYQAEQQFLDMVRERSAETADFFQLTNVVAELIVDLVFQYRGKFTTENIVELFMAEHKKNAILMEFERTLKSQLERLDIPCTVPVNQFVFALCSSISGIAIGLCFNEYIAIDEAKDIMNNMIRGFYKEAGLEMYINEQSLIHA